MPPLPTCPLVNLQGPHWPHFNTDDNNSKDNKKQPPVIEHFPLLRQMRLQFDLHLSPAEQVGVMALLYRQGS